MSQPVVIFDFDGTLIHRDSTLWLIKELVRATPWKLPAVLFYLAALYLAKSGNPDRLQGLKCRCIGSLIKGKTLGELNPALDRFRDKVMSVKIERAFDRVTEAVESGLQVLVVTASPAIAIAHALKNYPLTVSGSSYEIQNGRFTGAMLGQPCFGDEKVKGMDEWLTASKRSWADAVEAWGDSPSDWALMKKCSRRVWISNSPAKRELLAAIDPDGDHILV